MIGQKKDAIQYIYTNGLVWMYFKDGEKVWEKVLASYNNQECRVMKGYNKILITPNEFTDLVNKLKDINWC